MEETPSTSPAEPAPGQVARQAPAQPGGAGGGRGGKGRGKGRHGRGGGGGGGGGQQAHPATIHVPPIRVPATALPPSIRLFPVARRGPFATFLQTTMALFQRDLQIRFSRSRFAVIFTFLDPAFQILLFFSLSMLLFRKNLDPVFAYQFLLIGFLNLQLFTKASQLGGVTMEAARALLIYRRIRPFSIILARFGVDWVLIHCTGILLLLFGLLLGLELTIRDPAELIGLMLLYGALLLGLGTVFSVISVIAPSFGKIFDYMNRPMFLCSAVFHPVAHVPEEFRVYLYWNPVLYANEQMRVAIMPEYVTPVPNPWLRLLLFACGFLTLGAILLRRYHHTLLARR